MKTIRRPIDNERGAILFSVLALIVALTAGSVVLITMTGHELDVSANNKCQAQAFFNAESAMQGMMKVIDRTIEEAELVDNNDQQFAAHTHYDDLGASVDNDTVTDYKDILHGGRQADVNATKEEKFQYNETANIQASALNPPIHNYVQLTADINADVNWYKNPGRFKLAGDTLEFAAGYEGLGSGAGGVALFFRIISQGHGCIRSNFTVNGEYRYVTR